MYSVQKSSLNELWEIWLPAPFCSSSVWEDNFNLTPRSLLYIVLAFWKIGLPYGLVSGLQAEKVFFFLFKLNKRRSAATVNMFFSFASSLKIGK